MVAQRPFGMFIHLGHMPWQAAGMAKSNEELTTEQYQQYGMPSIRRLMGMSQDCQSSRHALCRAHGKHHDGFACSTQTY
jgi:hypothetical protein